MPGDRSVSPPAGEQDKDPQTAGRAGGDAEWVGQPRGQGPLQDQGRAQRSTSFILSWFVLLWIFLWLLRYKLSKNLFSLIVDLVDFHEMLQLPSQRQHNKTGRSLVHSVFWVRDFLHTPSPTPRYHYYYYYYYMILSSVIFRWVITTFQLNNGFSEVLSSDDLSLISSWRMLTGQIGKKASREGVVCFNKS